VGEVLQLARPNLLRGYGIADLTPYVVFPSRSLTEAFRAIDSDSAYAAGFSRLSDPALLDHPLLDLAGVTCILSTEALEHERLEPVLEREGFHVYRRLGARGRSQLKGCLLLPDSTEPPPKNEAQAFDPGATGAVLPIRREAPDRLEVLASRGWLLFLEQWAPGWKATVGGRDAPVERAFGFARALRVSGEQEKVRTRYEPWSLRVGALLTLLAAVVLLVWLRRDGRTAS
jgi:hypothetical protein